MNIHTLARSLPKIRIISSPKGEAPPEIRAEWIGVEIPCLYYDDHGVSKLISMEGNRLIDSYVSYIVFQQHAIEALEKEHPEAADWWRRKGFPISKNSSFAFSAESVEPLGEIMTRAQYFHLN